MSKINNAYESMFCTVETCTLQNKLFGECVGKKLEEYDKNPNYTYFEKHYGQIIPLDVYFFHG